MKRKYGDEQRLVIRNIRENFIKELEELYLKQFNQINEAGLGDGAIAKVTQLLLLSRDGAITPLRNEIEIRNKPEN